ncbi:MAG: protein phosphatase 2C domain-containing protein [Pyrinomonadaceae bacterium]
MNFQRGLSAVLTNLPAGQTPAGYYERGYAMFVADGMGGMPYADVASRTAILALIDLMVQTPDWIMRPDLPGTLEVLRRMEERFDQLPVAFKQLAEVQPHLAGMGTTMTLAVSLGADLIIAHVGASRAYIFRRGHLLRLTSDQTVAQTLAKAGVIRPEEVAGHFARRMLTSSITAGGKKTEVELHHSKLADGDQLLLCSDGLTEAVTEAAISEVLTKELPAAHAARALVGQALASGGEDDSTAVLGRYQIPEE